jgi:hypothetical protein
VNSKAGEGYNFITSTMAPMKRSWVPSHHESFGISASDKLADLAGESSLMAYFASDPRDTALLDDWNHTFSEGVFLLGLHHQTMRCGTCGM